MSSTAFPRHGYEGDPARLAAASTRPMHSGSPGYWVLFGFLTLLVLAGVGAWLYQLVAGLRVTGYNQSVPWAMYEADLVTFIGFSYGGALVSAILRLTGARWRSSITRIAEACALVTLLIGSAYVLVHLGRPERVFNTFFSPRGTSPIVWDAFAILTYLLITVIFFALPLVPDFGILARSSRTRLGAWRRKFFAALSFGWVGSPVQRGAIDRALMALSVLIVPIAVSVHSVLAWAFSLTIRPGWHSTIFAPYFVVAALYSGVALVIVALVAFRRAYGLEQFILPKQIRYLGYIMLTLGLTYLYFTFADMLTEGYTGTTEGVEFLDLLLTGQFAAVFWSWLVGGLLLPVLLVALPWTRNVPGITVAASLALAGMWLKRLLIVIPTMQLPLVGHEVLPYTPTWVELLLTVAGVAAIPWLLMLLFRLLPVLPLHEIEELGLPPDEPSFETETSSAESRGMPVYAARSSGGGQV